MQKLQFEPSWNKTVSLEDRERIKQVFLSTDLKENSGTHISHLWQARNHREELLVTVIIHNTNTTPLYFENIIIHYKESGIVMGEHTFSIPSLTIPRRTSMPWTFIFPRKQINENTLCENGYIEIISK